jgi:hypothetical protein
MVLVTIKGLPKLKAFRLDLPSRVRGNPDEATLHVCSRHPSWVPSYGALSEKEKDLVLRAVELSSAFNFGQFLQGENTPASLVALKRQLETHGSEVMKFYLFTLVATMCGILGMITLKCSLFMNQVNCNNFMMGLDALADLETMSPKDVYWDFIHRRAQTLDLADREKALVRLLCLHRVLKKGDAPPVLAAWDLLTDRQRKALTRLLESDGIEEPAHLLAFGPDLLCNAQKNESVGISAGLDLLVALADFLHEHVHPDKSEGTMMMKVDVTELAKFTQNVKVRTDFDALADALAVEFRRVGSGKECVVVVKSELWKRMYFAYEPSEYDRRMDLRRSVRGVLRCSQQELETITAMRLRLRSACVARVASLRDRLMQRLDEKIRGKEPVAIRV